ncbi:unnamed protein product [Boreogadus saida]
MQLALLTAALRQAAWHNGGGAGKVVHLALALEGTAIRVLFDLVQVEQRIQALTRAMERWFGQRTFSDQSQEQLAGRHRQEEKSLGAYAAESTSTPNAGIQTLLG